MEKRASIYIADHHALIGNALRARLRDRGFNNIYGASQATALLTDSTHVDGFFSQTKPEYVFLVGGRSGGIKANQEHPAELMLDNLLVNCNVIESARRYGVKRLIYLASSCVYPRLSEQPMRVESLMTGKLEPTNESYAIAKLAGLYLCQAYRQQFGADFIVAIPANVFGPGDDFNEENSHVIAALIRRVHEAKILGQPQVVVWGSGRPRREFIYSEDVAEACLFLMEEYRESRPINVGVGFDCSIQELAEMIKEVVGYSGDLRFDTGKPDGMSAKLLDSSPLRKMGWKPQIPIREGLERTYQWFLRSSFIVKGKDDARAVL